MSYQTQAAIGPYPVNCLLQAFMPAVVAVPRLTGIAAINDVSSSAIVDVGILLICRLTLLLLWLLPCSQSRTVTIAIGSRDAFDLFILLL
jgi:hypothetical protein